MFSQEKENDANFYMHKTCLAANIIGTTACTLHDRNRRLNETKTESGPSVHAAV